MFFHYLFFVTVFRHFSVKKRRETRHLIYEDGKPVKKYIFPPAPARAEHNSRPGASCVATLSMRDTTTRRKVIGLRAPRRAAARADAGGFDERCEATNSPRHSLFLF
jgi:hypothetical protein